MTSGPALAAVSAPEGYVQHRLAELKARRREVWLSYL
jgi:hypothetical protein